MKKLLLIFFIPIFVTMAMIATFVVAVAFVAQTVQQGINCITGVATAPIEFVIDGISLGGDLLSGGIDLGGDLIETGEDLVGDVFGGIADALPIPGLGATENVANLGFSQEQLNNAYIIYNIGVQRGYGACEIRIALATAMQESSLRNLAYGDQAGPDSRGLFQQRPTQGWGTFAEVMDPVYATNAFYDALDGIDNHCEIELWAAAQAVQRSAFPREYQKWADEADTLVAYFAGEAQRGVAIIGDDTTAEMQNSLSALLAGSGWQSVVVDTQTNRRSTANPSGEIPSGVEAIVQIKESSEITPNLWVIDLGSNDASSITSPIEAQATVDQVLEHIPSEAKVAWVSVHTPDHPGGELLNSALRAEARQRPGLTVLDWALYAESQPELLNEERDGYTKAGYEQRAAFVSRVINDPQAFGFPGLPDFSLPSGCELGGTLLGGMVDFALGQVGVPFGSSLTNPVESGQSFLSWVFGQSGVSLSDDPSDVPENGEVLDSFVQAQPGDLVYWATDDEQPELITQRGLYLGRNRVIIEPEPGEVVSVSAVNWGSVVSVVRPSNGEVSGISGWQEPFVDSYRIGSGFGQRLHPIDKVWRLHNGVDLSAPDGTSIYAAFEGTVWSAGYTSRNGYSVIIDHADGIQTRYVHLSEVADGIEAGVFVQSGQLLGEIGDCRCTNSTGTHLHFGTLVNGQGYDPVQLLREKGVVMDGNPSSTNM